MLAEEITVRQIGWSTPYPICYEVIGLVNRTRPRIGETLIEEQVTDYIRGTGGRVKIKVTIIPLNMVVVEL